MEQFRAAVLPRFRNPEIKDTLLRLATGCSDRIREWLLPVVRANLAAGRDVTLGAAICAAWARYCEGLDEQGKPLLVVDRLSSELTAAASIHRHDPTAFIRTKEVFGDLADVDAFREPYLTTLHSLWEHGSRHTLKQLLQR